MTTEEQLLEQLKRMNGWCGPEKALAFLNLVREIRPNICVDVGVFAGKSTLSMAYGLREIGSGIVVGVDAWEKSLCTFDSDEATRHWWGENVDLEAIYREFLGHCVDTQLSKYIRVLRMSSWCAARYLEAEVDLLHIDGSHDEFSSSSDV